MKRSQVNEILRTSDAFIARHGFSLPAWAHSTPAEWRTRGAEYDEIRRNMLGWDITDYGQGQFERVGLTLFTIRNGTIGVGKQYAEKLLISQEGQVCPCHFHFSKTEDIINRAGGRLCMQLWCSDADEALAEDEFTVSVDGVLTHCHPGEILSLVPGQSVTLTPRLYHAFWAEPGYGTVLVGEVSSVNDDNTDNRFLVPQARFPTIDEDEPPLWLLCNEY